MLGGNCSPCCGWRCYYTDEGSPPITPANFSLGDPECEDVRFVTIRLQWDTPYDGVDCIPEMTYDVDISADYDPDTSTGTWRPANLVNGGIAYYRTRGDVLANNVHLKCEYDVFYTEEMQLDSYRVNGYLPTRRVWFRVRSDARSGPYNGQTSAWAVVGPFNDPRYCGNNVAEVYRNYDDGWFEIPIMINHSGYSPQGCETPGALVDAFAITSTEFAVDPDQFPDPAVKQGMYFNDTTDTTSGLVMNAGGDAIEGTGLLAYDEDILTIWVLVQMQEAREVIGLIRMTMDY